MRTRLLKGLLNVRLLSLLFLSVSFSPSLFSLNANESYTLKENATNAVADCWAKVYFKNTGCTSAVIYRRDYGKWIFYTKLKQNETWAVTSKKGTEWGISDGHSIKKKWWVTSCYTQTVDVNFGGCYDHSDYSCQATVTFKNLHCKTLSIYWDNDGHHVHYKELKPHDHWSIHTKKGHKWLIKDGHTIKKIWTVSSCSNHAVSLDFGGCSYSHSACQTKVKFINDHCKKLSIFWNNNGHYIHYKDLEPHHSWIVTTKKGHEWVIKEDHTIKKKYVVNSCYDQDVSLKFGSCHEHYGSCHTKVTFKNEHCEKLSIFQNKNGHYVHHKDISSGYSWTASTKKGDEWIIKQGHTIKKKHHVTTCEEHSVKLSFGGCHGYSSSCTTKVGFRNLGCKTLSIYWDNNGHHIHYKNLGHNGYWKVNTRKGHKWIIKDGHTVKKNWTVPSCSEHTVKLDFGGCGYSNVACSVKVGFINRNCKTLKIYWNDGGKHVHYKDLGHNSYWRVNTKKGHEWIIKEGDVIKKKWTVTHCSNHNISLNYGGCNDDLCSDGSKKQDPGTHCNDYDDKTENDVIQEDGCTCAGTPISSSSSDECEMSNDDYEKGWGNWYDGGADCNRYYSSSNHLYGDYSISLKNNNGWSSSTYSAALNMHGHNSVKVDFVYRTANLTKNESFALEYSPDDGKTWYKAKKWYKDIHFSNNKMYHESISFKSTFSNRTRFRFRCYASSTNNHVYLDNVKISSCHEASLTTDLGKESLGKSRENSFEMVDDFNVFPNPTVNVLNLSGLEDYERFSIYSIDGKVVMQNVSQKSVDVSRLESGAYFVKSEHGKLTKFIKR